MQYILAVFRSRSQTLDFISKLRKYGIYACAVSTPREANVGCGISARINAPDLEKAKRLVYVSPNMSFVGFFRVENRYGKIFVKPI